MPNLSPRAASRAAQVFTPTVVQELATLEREMGGRTGLVGMLVLAPLTPDLRYVLGLLGDPSKKGLTLAEICALGNVLPGDLLQHLASAALLKGKVLASQKIGAGIAAVAEDVMRRAAPYEDACSVCRGVGMITPEPTKDQPNPSPETCETCLGTGKLTYRPTIEHQKLAIDMAQLLPKAAGIQIANINGAGGATAGGLGSSLEAVQRLTDQLLYKEAPPEAIDAETIDPDGEPETAEGAP
jgi:hypothetical protein